MSPLSGARATTRETSGNGRHAGRWLRDGRVLRQRFTHDCGEAHAAGARELLHALDELLVEEKAALMRKLGKRELVVTLAAPVEKLPDSLASDDIHIKGRELSLTFSETQSPVGRVLAELGKAGIEIADVRTSESSLEDIFVELVGAKESAA